MIYSRFEAATRSAASLAEKTGRAELRFSIAIAEAWKNTVMRHTRDPQNSLRTAMLL
jgi:hypothetical protein